MTHAPLRFPWEHPPEEGTATEVAEGVLWLRLPLPMALDHVNIFALDDGDGWTLVDTGVHSKRAVALWEAILAGPLAGKPVSRVLLTHHHPDHIGMAGWFADRGAELVTTRTAWLMGRMLTLAVEERASPEALQLYERAGMAAELLKQRRADRPFNFADIVAPLPVSFTRIKEGDVYRLGGRDWDVRIGNGHAPEQALLWSRDDNLVLGGDQLLPSISPNIGVYPTEPAANPLADWLESCERLTSFARDDQLVLPGHKLPFTGLPARMAQLAGNHHTALDRLRAHLATPKTAAQCFEPLFVRKITSGTYGLALAESMAHLNYLFAEGTVTRTLGDDGAWYWQAKEPG